MTDQELLDVLAAAVRSRLGEGRSIVRLERRPSPYRSSFALEEVDVALDGAEWLHLVLKDLGWSALSADAQRVKPRFMHDPLRETATYREILGPCALGAPQLFAAVPDPGRGRHLLVLERVLGRPLYEVGDLAVWEEVARWAARMHARLAPRAGRLAARARLVRHDADFYWTWLDRARRFTPSPHLETLADGYGRVVERLTALTPTVIHGELYPSNVLVESDGAVPRVRVVDWEVAGLGPGLVDLAALTGGRLGGPFRAVVTAAYRDVASGAAAASGDDFDLTLDSCRLHLAIQWLGWSRGWTPPAEHVHDWLGEALEMGRRLGLLPR